MIVFRKRNKAACSRSDAPICSPSSWPEMDGGFVIYRSGPPVKCHGDAIIDNLRIARGRLVRSLKTLTKCTKTAIEDEPRYDYGRYLDGVVDDLADGALESMDWTWFMRRAETVMECVVEAEAEPDEDCPSPEKDTWPDFRALSAALREHGQALKQLQAAEKMAAPSPVNAGDVPRDNARPSSETETL